MTMHGLTCFRCVPQGEPSFHDHSTRHLRGGRVGYMALDRQVSFLMDFDILFSHLNLLLRLQINETD